MKRLLDKFLDILAPDGIKCIVCDKELNIDDSYSMCASCKSKLPYIKKSCEKCGREIYDKGTLCFDCKEGGGVYDRVYSCLNYEGIMSKLIYNLKYGGNKYLAKYLAQFLVDKIKDERISFDFITAVPLNTRREKSRGFNQAKLIADEAASILGEKYIEVLTRVVDTPFQAQQTREDRLTNLKGAFEIIDKKLVKDKTILIVDDIFTTGSTITECARVLKSAGAKSVIGITLTHAKKKFV